MQEKVQEKLKAEETAAMMRERENKQQLLAEKEKNRQAMILREVEQQRQRQLEEDKRKQEQIAKEAEERRKQNEEIKKIKEATNSQEVEKHTSKININEKFADLLKATEGKSLKPPWKNEGNLSLLDFGTFIFLSVISLFKCTIINVTQWQTYCLRYNLNKKTNQQCFMSFVSYK